MNARKIMRSAALLALVAALTAPGGPAPAAAPVLKHTDFNGDGYNDVAVGSPNYVGYAGTGNSGMVAVLYGGPNGLAGQHIFRPLPGCTSGQSCTGWGQQLSAADIDANGKTDLVFAGNYDLEARSWTSLGITTVERRVFGPVGHPWQMAAGQFDEQPGADIVAPWKDGYYWDRIGGWYNRAQGIDLRGFEDSASFSLKSNAAGDVDGDGRLEMAIVADKRYGSGDLGLHLWLADEPHRAPVKLIELGSPTTCTPPTLSGRVCPKDDSQVAMGDVTGDGHIDLIMLTPSTALMQVWYGSAAGLSTHPGYTAYLFWLATAGLSPTMTVGDVTGDGAAEIAIGAAGATVSGHSEAGAVVVIPGSVDGPLINDAQFITQDGLGSVGDGALGSTQPPAAASVATGPLSDPIGEQSQAGDHFGKRVTIIDVTGDGKGEVIVGAPAKNGEAGMLVVLRGLGTGVSATDAQVVHPRPVGLTYPRARLGQVLLR